MAVGGQGRCIVADSEVMATGQEDRFEIFGSNQERDLAIRTIRDYLTSDIDQIWIDNEEVFERATKWFKAVMPRSCR